MNKNNTKKLSLKNDGSRLGRYRVPMVLGGGLLATLMLVGGSIAAQDTPSTQPTAGTTDNAAPKANPQQVHSGALIEDGLGTDGKLNLLLNKTTVINTKVPYRRVSVGQPEIADVNTIGPTSILVTAKKVGSTQLIIWDDAERSQAVDINVAHDLATLQDQLKTVFPDSNIEVTGVNGSIALRGRVASLDVAEQAAEMATPYATDNAKVMNFLEISGGQQVMLQVRFAEVSRSAANNLGVNLGFTDGVGFGGSNVGQISPFGQLGGGLAVPTGGAGVTLFGGGQFGNVSLRVFVEALRQNNLMRMLAEPNLIATSGQEASFLAGGEFPVPVPQSSSGGGSVITIEYREFGVRLKFTPIVLGNGRIRLKVSPEVSDLDFSSPVINNGFRIPIVNKRTVTTTIELAEGQTFAVAGLLNNQVTSTKDVTPLLGDLPIIGALFRSVRYSRKETELVVLVTPRLVSPMNPDQVPALPGETWRYPNEAELYINRDLGGPGADTKHAPKEAVAGEAPRFQGQNGFAPVVETDPQAVSE